MPQGIGYARGSKAEDYSRKAKKRPAPKEKPHIGKVRMTAVTPEGFLGSMKTKVQRVNSVSDKTNMSRHEATVEQFAPKKKGNRWLLGNRAR